MKRLFRLSVFTYPRFVWRTGYSPGRNRKSHALPLSQPGDGVALKIKRHYEIEMYKIIKLRRLCEVCVDITAMKGDG